MAKRLKHKSNSYEDAGCDALLDSKILSSDINDLIQAAPVQVTHAYHTSICGSILHSAPSNSSADIFSYLRHANFDAFRRSLDIHHNDIIRMRNEHEQTVLHILAIHAYPYLWVRLLMMRGCDTCAQDADGYTAAHYAVERDDVEMLKALTMRFFSQVKPISEQQTASIHQQCLRALTLKNQAGLTVFMLACHRESLKCLNYLIELGLNDSDTRDEYGDTCLHYAVARRNQILIELLIQKCNADVNGGDVTRPSILDVVQYNREEQKPFERNKDDDIERFLLSQNARNRCCIRRVVRKRKDPTSDEETVVPNLSCLSLELTSNGQIETARSHARVAAALQAQGNTQDAQASYQSAMVYTPENTLEWATYAFHLAIVHRVHGEQQLALDLLHKALETRKKLEKSSEEIDRLHQTIDDIQKHIV